MPILTRRQFILTSSGLLTTCALPTTAALGLLTPRQSTGPFYPYAADLESDNNLLQVAGRSQPALGEATDLSGRVLNRDGQPVPDARVELWQCDANGRYHHPRDSGVGDRDKGFQGFGFTVTDSQGRYRFRTIRPVPYPGRTPHIHVAVYPRGGSPLITQLYVAGEPRNGADFLYQRIPVEQRSLVTVDFTSAVTDEVMWLAEKNLVLNVTPT